VEITLIMVEINKKRYRVKAVNRYRNNSPKTQIIIATSLRRDSNHILRYQHKEFGNTKKWCTYTITRDGYIYEHYDPHKHSDFLGNKLGDKQSISIVMENMGYLFKTSNGDYVNWLGEVCDKEKVIEKKWLGYQYWENISDIQLNACGELCNMLSDKFGIRKTVMEFQHYHKLTHKFRGIVFRSNYIEESNDISPFVNINKLKELVENYIEE
jgi:hypothetical protein